MPTAIIAIWTLIALGFFYTAYRLWKQHNRETFRPTPAPCIHEGRLNGPYCFEHVPCASEPHHTTVVFFICPKCRQAIPFGPNIELADPTWTADLIAELELRGVATDLLKKPQGNNDNTALVKKSA